MTPAAAAPVQRTPLPGWVSLSMKGEKLTLAGYLVETEVGGAPFIDLRTGPLPKDRSLRLINASLLNWFQPLSEDTAREIMRRQWAGSQ